MTNHRLGGTRGRAGATVAALVAILALAGCGPADQGAQTRQTTGAGQSPTAATAASASPSPTPTPAVTTTTSAPPTASPTVSPSTTTPPVRPKPTVVYRTVLRPGDHGSLVRELQARLRQIGWFDGKVTDSYGSRTTTAVKGFQAKRGFPVTGVVDQRTWDRLLAMTRKPTRDELNNVLPAAQPRTLRWDVDQRCLTGRVICISKSTRSLTWVIDGKAQYAMAVRFGSEAEPTREGTFYIYKKQVDVISNLYFTPMPYSMFFSGGQAIHYSGDFARNGYNGSSHGCINVRDWNGLVRLYNTAPVGTKVVVHW